MANESKMGPQGKKKQQASDGLQKPGPKSGLGNLPGKKKKEDSSVTLGKFMKAKVSGLEESAKKGGMRADRAFANFRRPEAAKKAALKGDFSKNIKDANYYKSIGLTGERGDKAVKDFFKPLKLAKGGRAGYSVGGKAIKGVSKILLKK